jgi:hypothetical protein
LIRTLFSLHKVASGDLAINNRRVRIRSPYDAIRQGIGYIPEDRKSLGLFPHQDRQIERMRVTNRGFTCTKAVRLDCRHPRPLSMSWIFRIQAGIGPGNGYHRNTGHQKAANVHYTGLQVGKIGLRIEKILNEVRKSSRPVLTVKLRLRATRRHHSRRSQGKHERKPGVEAVEAVVVGVSETADGTQEVELETRCPAAGFERANVVVGPWRVAVLLDRPLRAALHKVKVSLQAAQGRLKPGDKAVVEFFHPGEQARVHCAGAGHSPE